MGILGTPQKMVFRPQSRLISLLGEQLISDQAVGLIELVKNAYDADATSVDIELLNLENAATTHIVVRDNGTGMTYRDIEQKWFSPAVSHKEKQKKNRQRTPLGRLPIGEKGVGRFATHQLGHRLEIISRSVFSPEVVVQIDWDCFDQGDNFLDDISVMVYEREPVIFISDKTGTYLNIQKARTVWNETLVKKVQSSLRRLQSPNRDENAGDFLITFLCPDFPAYQDISNSDILDHAHYRFRGLVTKDGSLDFEYVCHHPDVLMREIREDDRNLVPAAIRELVEPVENFPPFYINLYVWDRTPVYLTQSKVSRADLDAMAGVSIFRDGLRVLPYGEDGNDWLELDKERINNMSKRIGNQQIIGFIEVSQEETPGLRDKTNREGLIDNIDFRNLRALVRAAINVLTSFWLEDRPGERKSKKNGSLESSGDSLHKARKIAEKVKETASDNIVVLVPPSSPIEQSVQALVPLSQEDSVRQEGNITAIKSDEATSLTQRQAMNQLTTHLQEATAYQQKHDEDTERKEQDLMYLAATGMAAERVTHEFGRQVGAALKALQILRDHIKPDGEGMKALNTLEACLGTLRNEFRVLAPYETGWRTQRTSIVSIDETVRLAITLNQTQIDKLGIVTNIQGGDFDVVAKSASLAQVIDNLVHNACNWLEGCKGIKSITILLNRDEHTLTITDTGPGVPLHMQEEIFKPFVTLRNGGRGLGLYIVQEILRSMNGSIKLQLQAEENRGAQFILKFPRPDSI